MRRNPEYLIRAVADRQVIVPVGAAAENFIGMIAVNVTGAYLWEKLAQEQTPDTLVEALLDKYEVTREQALKDTLAFLEKLRAAGALIED